MSPSVTQTTDAATHFPRVSGDEPGYGRHFITLTIFSPRERG